MAEKGNKRIVTLHANGPHRYFVHVDGKEEGTVYEFRHLWYLSGIYTNGYETAAEAADRLARERGYNV